MGLRIRPDIPLSAHFNHWFKCPVRGIQPAAENIFHFCKRYAVADQGIRFDPVLPETGDHQVEIFPRGISASEQRSFPFMKFGMRNTDVFLLKSDGDRSSAMGGVINSRADRLFAQLAAVDRQSGVLHHRGGEDQRRWALPLSAGAAPGELIQRCRAAA